MVRNMKRLLALIVAMLLVPCMALASSRVIDDAGLFSQSEIAQMEELIAAIQDTYQMDVVVLTSYDAKKNDTQDFADLYYENHAYGIGEDDAGLLYLIDMNNRVPCISTTGAMADYITDSRLEELFDCSYDQLRSGQYGQSTLTLLRHLEGFLRAGRQEGSFRYDRDTGKRLSGVYNPLTGTETLVALLAGLAVAFIMYRAVTSRYSLKGGTYRYNLAENASCKLTRNDETFLRQTVSVVRHDSNSGGGGGGSHGGSGSAMHTSSSGGSHGGGVGRGF